MLRVRELQEYEQTEDRLLMQIPIDKIYPNPYQPRKTMNEDGLEELAQSISMYGLLQPIVVRVGAEGKYELIAGERRLRASKRAGQTHISCVVYTACEQDSAMIALIENLQRENLHFLEEAEGYANILRGHGMTQEELAGKLGKNQSTIANKLRILKLSPRIKSMVASSRMTERHARALLRVRDEDTQARLIAQIVKNSLSVKETESLIERTLAKKEETEGHGRHVIRLLRDHRLFINTIKHAVEQLNDAGIPADCKVQDTEGAILINVSIPKQHT